MIAANNGAEEIGIWNYIDQLTTRTESPMTIYNFIRDRIEDGSLVLQPGSKKSRKVLTLSSTLEASLHRFLAERYIHSADCGSVAVGTTDRDITIDTVPIASIGYHGMSARRTA